MRVLVTGATGFIGSSLVAALAARGDRPTLVSRTPDRVTPPEGGEVVGEVPDLSGFGAVVNLAGEPVVGKRWTIEQKARIGASRLWGTKQLVVRLQQADPRPKVLVSASAIGFYGHRGKEVLDEDSAPGTGFLADVCRAWEANASVATSLDVRTVLLRIGIVLGRDGGALSELLPIFRLGLGGPIGLGRQWMSWIHLEDLCRMILFAVDGEEVEGPINGTAPNPVTNREFSRALGRALRRPAILPVPTPALRVRFGEAASVLTASQRCSAERVVRAGFEFTFSEVGDALSDVIGR